jgi:hypothetical protein
VHSDIFAKLDKVARPRNVFPLPLFLQVVTLFKRRGACVAVHFCVKLNYTLTMRNQFASFVLFLVAAEGVFHSTKVGGQVAAAYDRAPHPVAQPAAEAFAWRVQGRWMDARAGKEVSTGDAVLPGSLLEPLGASSAHSLTLLMADGQRVLSECFTVEDCSRGFRVPSMAEPPPEFDVEMLDRMRSVIERSHTTASSPIGRTTPAQQDEVVASLLPNPIPDHGGMALIKVQGLLGSMPSGSYTYTLGTVDRPWSLRRALPPQKASGCIFPIAGPGLYRITIYDSFDTKRLDVFVAAVEPGRTAMMADFVHAKKVLAGWNEQYYGWPVHDLLRAYLESFEAP